MLLSFAKRTYRAALPVRLQKMGYNLFAAAVRNRVVRRDLGGYVAELHLGENMELGAYVGEFEPDMDPLIKRLARPGMVVLDIGANVGLHALNFARQVFPGGRVYAFEATEFAYRKLARNAELNPALDLEPLHLAVSNEAALAVEVDFRSSWRTDGSRSDSGKSVVDFARLDDWVAERGLSRIDIIKLDVDGYEGLVLDGARDTVARFHPDFLIEAWTGQYGTGRPDAFAILASFGYEFHTTGTNERLTPETIPLRLAEMSAKGSESFNVVATWAEA
jgi:FkbM family methyltransferase